MRWLLLLALIVAPAIADAGWQRCPGTNDTLTTSVARPGPGQMICHRDEEDNADPPRVATDRCNGGVDVFFDADLTGSNTAATVQVYTCTSTTDSGTTNCEELWVDFDGDGGIDQLPLNGDWTAGRAAIYGIPQVPLFFDLSNAGQDETELQVVCRGD